MTRSNKNLLDAIKKQQIELIQKIINSGFDVRKNISFEKPDLFEKDKHGRTLLFDAVKTGNLKIVEILIFSLMGTGMGLQRLALIEIEDNEGKTAADVAKENGFIEVKKLLLSEKGRMEFFE